jgi:hypothetical protein
MTSIPQHSAENANKEQRECRDCIMEIDLFPDLDVRLKKALGYGPHCDMMQHIIHWFSPQYPKMERRWTLWKTFEEWYEECGLSDRQVKKGRDTLRKLGLLTWKRGQHSYVHYRVDWVKLADLLGIPVEYDFEDEWDFEDPEFMSDGNTDRNESLNQESMSDGNTGQLQVGRYYRPASSRTLLPSDSIQESTSGDYEQENSSLQEAAEPAFAEPAAPKKNGKTPDHHPQEEETRLEFEDLINIEQLVNDPDDETRTAAALEAFESGIEDLAFVIGAVRADLDLWYADNAELEQEVRGCIGTRDKRKKGA